MHNNRLGIIVILMSVLSLFFLLVTTYHQREITECQARVNQTFLRTLKERGEINSRFDDSVTKLVERAFTSKNEKQFFEAYAKYQEDLATYEKLKADAKYPEIEKVCE